MKILVCTDFSAASSAGERVAARRFPDAELVVFHALDARLVSVIEGLTARGGDEVHRSMSTYADERLNEIVERLVSEGHRASAELVEGEPVDAALAAAARLGVSLIVVGVAPDVALGRFRTLTARRTRVPLLCVPAEP
jgi:hypothetical protein